MNFRCLSQRFCGRVKFKLNAQLSIETLHIIIIANGYLWKYSIIVV